MTETQTLQIAYQSITIEITETSKGNIRLDAHPFGRQLTFATLLLTPQEREDLIAALVNTRETE